MGKQITKQITIKCKIGAVYENISSLKKSKMVCADEMS